MEGQNEEYDQKNRKVILVTNTLCIGICILHSLLIFMQHFIDLLHYICRCHVVVIY